MMKRWMLLPVVLCLFSLSVFAVNQAKAALKAASDMTTSQGVNALNQKEVDACRKMDHAASAALWADDGSI